MNEREHALTIFAEEIGELAIELLNLQKQIFKAQRFGLDEQRDLPTSNRERIQAEWQDLLGSIVNLKKIGIELTPDLEAINKKLEKIDRYSHYARELGTLQASQEEA